MKKNKNPKWKKRKRKQKKEINMAIYTHPLKKYAVSAFLFLPKTLYSTTNQWMFHILGFLIKNTGCWIRLWWI